MSSLSERTRWCPPEKSPVLAAFEERCRKAKQQPFLDETLMDEREIACSWSDFKRPLLRRYNLQGSLIFIDVVGYGVDGIVWRVEVGCRIMALKVVSSTLRSIATVS